MNSLMATFLVLLALMAAGGIAAPTHNYNSNSSSNSANATLNNSTIITIAHDVTAINKHITVLKVRAIAAIISLLQEILFLQNYTVRHYTHRYSVLFMYN